MGTASLLEGSHYRSKTLRLLQLQSIEKSMRLDEGEHGLLLAITTGRNDRNDAPGIAQREELLSAFDVPGQTPVERSNNYRLPLAACSRSTASNKALKLPAPKPSKLLR